MKGKVYFLLEKGRNAKSSISGICVKFDKEETVTISGWYDGNCTLGEERISLDSFLSKLKSIGIEQKEAKK